jgi:E1A/CREB-binding protein
VREAIQRHHERAKVVAEEKMKQIQARSGQAAGGGNMPMAEVKKQNKRPGAVPQSRPSKKTKREPVENQQPNYTPHVSSDRKQLQEGTSLINTFDNALIGNHINSLRKHFNPLQTSNQLKAKLQPLLKKLTEHKYGFIFASPVDPVALNIPDYFTIITCPMDLGTARKRLEASQYKHSDEFAADVHLTFDNAIKYNEDQSPVNAVAKELKGNFEQMYSKVVAEMSEEEKRRRDGADACRLCGGEKFLYEPVVFYCNGPCASRVRRNSYYYTCRENKHHWCQQCWQELKEETIELPEATLHKKELIKKKNDEVHEEGWVQCETCNRWVHQICALFNGRNNASSAAYHCPVCVMNYRKAGDVKFKCLPPAAAAADLKGTKCGDFIENRVKAMLKVRQADQAKKTGGKPEDQMTARDISIKMVLNCEKSGQTSELFHARYKESHKYPEEFTFRCRCIVMFQTLQGVDVLLFGMYVYEFGDECPQPNQRRIYVSYLDTVKYMEPPQLRTPIYHEILQAYLEYVRLLGHHTAHIWACPPLKGDDYILYCKPEDQKTPKPERLRDWYIKMLEDVMEGTHLPHCTAVTVNHLSDIFADYFKGPLPVTAARLPNFKGDYWVGLADDLLKTMEDEKNEKKEDKKDKAKVRHRERERCREGRREGRREGVG